MRKPIPPGDPSSAAPPNEDRAYFEHCGDHPFKYDSGEFELVNAWWMAEAALLAYADEDFVEACFGEAGLPEVRYFHGESTQCYAAHNDDFVLVAFSGTDMRERAGNNAFDALADWMVNLSFDTVPSGAEGLDLPVYRFVNGGDAVPKLPVRGPYLHAGVEKYIDDEGRIQDGKPGGGGVRAKGGRLVRRLHPSRPSGGALRDHSPILYAVHIWNAYVRE